jgi:hypothetical protein
MMASREEAVKISSSYWIQGLQLLNTTLNNETLTQKYLENYFNSLYDVEYRLNTVYPFAI